MFEEDKQKLKEYRKSYQNTRKIQLQKSYFLLYIT